LGSWESHWENGDIINGIPDEYEDVKVFWCSEGDFHEDWFDCSSETTYCFIATIFLTDDTTLVYWYDFETLISLPTPSNLTYDSTDNTLYFSSSESSTSTLRIIEFERTDDYNPTNTTEDQRLLFYLASLVNTESGYFGYVNNNNNILYRFF